MFKNLKLGVKLAIGFGLIVALMAVISVLAFTRVGVLNEKVNLMANDRFPKTVLVNDTINDLDTIARRLRNAMLADKPDVVKAELDQIPDLRKQISENIDKLDKSITSDKGRDLLKTVSSTRAAYVASQDVVIKAINENRRADAVTAIFGDLRKTQGEYMGALKALNEFQTKIMEADGDEAEALAQQTRTLVLVTFLVALVLAALAAWIVTRSITKPIGDALDVATRIAEGDLTA
ncbi:MCP four helix bundle domain-containing protein, partial [Uliginosibacterium flavum]